VLRLITDFVGSLSINRDQRTFVGLMAVLIGSWLLAVVTKRFIEAPGIETGRKLLSLRMRSLGAAS
jgi:peptidoglycan/LPS O-acetylase OafA/YrhL